MQSHSLVPFVPEAAPSGPGEAPGFTIPIAQLRSIFQPDEVERKLTKLQKSGDAKEHESLRSTYQPVSDRVGRGERVARGDRIGTLDVGGHCLLADCLHLGAVRGRDTYVDPTPLLLGAELTLLPVGGLP